MEKNINILVVADSSQGGISSLAAELLSLARSLATDSNAQVCFLPFGVDAAILAEDAAAAGADILCTNPRASLSGYHPEEYANIALAAIKKTNPALVLLAHSPLGQDLAPRLAFHLGIRWAGGCVAVTTNDKGYFCTRTEVGGKLIVAENVDTPAVITLRPKSVDVMTPDVTRKVTLMAITGEDTTASPSITFVARKTEEGGAAAELEKAEVIISGGIGIGASEPFAKLQQVADALGGVVGASKLAVDRGWIEPDRQVGLTGTTVAPKLYIAVGISGAPQHMAGCQKSKVIVAINNDREAPIFSYAKYGLVGDWEEIVEALSEKLSMTV